MEIHRSWTIALVLGSLFLLGSNGVILKRNYDTEWRRYQKEYLALAEAKATDEQARALIRARSPRIEQIVSKRWGHQLVDRCTTCHAGIDDPRFADEPQPFTTHPEIPGNHPYRLFGCTTCHGGNGRGLSVEDAHGLGKHWKEPALRGIYVQSACAKCHPAPYLEETPVLRRGAKLFMEKACYGCHKITGLSNGKLGVELTRVGLDRSLEFLRESIVDPKANNAESLMPKMELTDDEVDALVVFLKSLTGENLIQGPVSHYVAEEAWKQRAPEEVDVTVESGRKLFREMGCMACHTVNGEGGKIGPDLSVYGLMRTREWSIAHHRDPRSLIAGSRMPDFEYSESQLQALALYLETLTELTADNAAIYGGASNR